METATPSTLDLLLTKLNYSFQETADLTGLSIHTVARDVRRKKIRIVHYGRRSLVPREEVIRIAREGMKPVVGER